MPIGGASFVRAMGVDLQRRRCCTTGLRQWRRRGGCAQSPGIDGHTEVIATAVEKAGYKLGQQVYFDLTHAPSTAKRPSRRARRCCL